MFRSLNPPGVFVFSSGYRNVKELRKFHIQRTLHIWKYLTPTANPGCNSAKVLQDHGHLPFFSDSGMNSLPSEQLTLFF